MNEYILLIRAKGDPMAKLPKDRQRSHIEKTGAFIKAMHEEGIMNAAQPLKPQGAIVSKGDDKMVHIPIDPSRELIAGYYIIQAETLDDAIKVAKTDPRFEEGNWKIEVRPVMKVEGINQ
ncbi:MAG: hypothetical protein HKO93_03520 [Flavobacteriales bacterium]|nr:hypothetical protein [Flavobacteriales bacterium]